MTKEITASIRYASRIQSAILPPEEYINMVLPEHFILFRPCDIVSGDFYWVTDVHNKIITVAADCTGHGVPGAFMSLLGMTYLKEIVNKENIIQANEILNKLREYVMKSLHQTGRDDESKDGMDVALCVLNKKTNRIEFAGANNPLYIISRYEITGVSNTFSHEGLNLYEIKPDKMPIGIHAVAETTGFRNYELTLNKGDSIYIFSDGFADQFGGAKGKKFKYHSLKQLLLENCNKPMSDQKIALYTAFDNWRGKHQQVDDVVMIGIRIS